MKAVMFRRVVAISSLVVAVQFLAPAAQANHSWAGYHWARTANPFTVALGDNVSSVWDPVLRAAAADWGTSAVLDTTVVAGKLDLLKRCNPTSGRVEVCNSTYGQNGWLGIAQVWTTGTHIVQGTVKLNDSYFNMAKYNTPAWRALVTCQEVGHTFGLDHQDENFTNPNLGTCMDYTNDPTSNQHPNAHDYAELASIYSHLDTTNTAKSAAPLAGLATTLGNVDEWGQAVRFGANGRPVLFVQNLAGGDRAFTWVTWAD